MDIQVVSQGDIEKSLTEGAQKETSEEPKEVATDVAEETKSEADAESAETKPEAPDTEEKEESEEKSEGDDEGEEKPERKHSRAEKRIKQLVNKLSAKDQEIEYLRQAAFKNQSQESKQQESKPAQERVNEGLPDPDNFETVAEYTAALVNYHREQDRAAQAKVKEQEAFNSSIKTYNERLASFQKEHPDFGDVLSEVADINVTKQFEDMVLSSEYGPAIVYDLAKDRVEAERVMSLDPLNLAREIGRREALIISKNSQPKQQEAKKTTKAPPPITPVGSRSSGSVEKDPGKMSHQEFKAWREASTNKRNY